MSHGRSWVTCIALLGECQTNKVMGLIPSLSSYNCYGQRMPATLIFKYKNGQLLTEKALTLVMTLRSRVRFTIGHHYNVWLLVRLLTQQKKKKISWLFWRSFKLAIVLSFGLQVVHWPVWRNRAGYNRGAQTTMDVEGPSHTRPRSTISANLYWSE